MVNNGVLTSGKLLTNNYGKIHHAMNGYINYFYGKYQQKQEDEQERNNERSWKTWRANNSLYLDKF